MKVEESEQQRPRGIYLLPNLFTTSGLFLAFYSIVFGMRGQFSSAAFAIFVAMIADFLDGRVARMTNTQTAFGAEYDSLSDMVAFGVAPALIVYSWGLHTLGKFGWLAAFIFTAAGALRLARFNTQLGVADKRYFQGLPIPSAAAVVTSMVWIASNYSLTGLGIYIVAALITVMVGILMVSNIRYYSFKDWGVKGRVPFTVIFLIVLLFVIISIDPPVILFGSFTLYAISGPLLTLWRIRQMKMSHQKTKS